MKWEQPLPVLPFTQPALATTFLETIFEIWHVHTHHIHSNYVIASRSSDCQLVKKMRCVSHRHGSVVQFARVPRILVLTVLLRVIARSVVRLVLIYHIWHSVSVDGS